MKITLLRKLSLTYILIPNLLFSFGWFRQPYSGILIAGFIFLLIRELKKKNEPDFLPAKDLFFTLLFAIVWTFFSGAGGLSDQKSDFFAHNAKFYDLYKNPWPTYFPEVGRYACYYFGYYLVPSFLGKITGDLSPSFIYFWSVLGYFLGFSWVYLLIGRKKVGLFAFLWFRGIGYVLCLALQKSHIMNIPLYRPVINGIVQQSSYAPNQFLGTLIVTCILIHDVFVRKEFKEIWFPITLVFIWSVFPSISLSIIYLIVWVRHFIIKQNYMTLCNWSSLASFILPAILLLPTLGYFLSANQTTVKGLLWQFGDPFKISFYHFTGIMIDLVVYFLLIRSLKHREKLIPFWFTASLLTTLFVFSLYRVGFHNDWFYRTQIPIFIILVIVLIRGAYDCVEEKLLPAGWLNRSLSLLIVIMMFIQLSAYVHLLRDNIIVKTLFPSATSFKPMPYDRFPNVYLLMKKMYQDRGDAEQYLGQKNSFYELHLAPKTDKN
ncbi:hypothetical protein [Dyadobacter diqingensis]|uniref:hypothetical protein n=1 Tax=Dyadobacter diqingensis TaxID=2938121 RepID=UPI0020C1B328|nr:hypothetical protein [Dyadobacter diqingensis]